LLFHDISDYDLAAFDRLIGYIATEHGTLTPEEATAWLERGPPPRPNSASWKAPCLLTFDDGFASNFQVANSILNHHGVKALFFVCPGLTDLSGEAQRAAVAERVFEGRIGPESLPPSTRLMTWDELAQLKQNGHEIGCHGMLHRRLSELQPVDLAEEIITAADLMDERLSQTTRWYAYAFGDIGSINTAALGVIASRFRHCRSGLRGANGADGDAMAVSADSISPAAPLPYQKLLLEGGLDFLYSKRRRHLSVIATKALSHHGAT